ncbi:hypothetical protein [Nonomuraea dietziae]|uniref:hypothetical protein n=1 Tax=Nonomuraea dietziae TaxID=65515 RepID=UPI0033C407C5
MRDLARLRSSRLGDWGGPLLVTLLGALLRFSRLDVPRSLVFDETEYALNGYAMITFGVERLPQAGMRPNGTGMWQSCPVVVDCAMQASHPPLGNWMIAAGEWLFGMNSFGRWR